MWKTTNQESVGRSHVTRDIPCQDKTYSLKENGVNAIVLADGAGSARLSHYGAETTTKMVGELLCNSFDDIFENEDPSVVSTMVINYIKGGLREKSRELDCVIKDLASTLLAVAIKDNKYMVMHLGDGVIGFSRNGELKVASTPTNGKFANQTVFTTSESADKNLKLFKGEIGNIEAFVLMSDGTAESLHDKRRGILAEGTGKLIEFTKVFSKNEMDKYTKKTLDQVIVPQTADDCSIAIIAFKEDESLAFSELPLDIKSNILGLEFKSEKGIKKYENILKVLEEPKTPLQIARRVGTRRLKHVERDLKQLKRSGAVKTWGTKYYRVIE